MGDDKAQFGIHLPEVPADVDSLEVVLFINGESSIRLNRASGIRARVINPATGATMFRAPLAQVGRSAAVRLMQVYRHRGDWKVRAVCDEWADVPAMLRGFGL
jgi:terD family tellurium resistance protein